MSAVAGRHAHDLASRTKPGGYICCRRTFGEYPQSLELFSHPSSDMHRGRHSEISPPLRIAIQSVDSVRALSVDDASRQAVLEAHHAPPSNHPESVSEESRQGEM